MNSNPSSTLTQNRLPFTTEGLAAAVITRPQSIRKRLSQTGSYFGLRPIKLPNGRLLWPKNSIEILTSAVEK